MRALSKVLLPRKRRPGVITARKARHLRARTDGTAATSPPLVSARTTRTRTRTHTRDAARARHAHNAHATHHTRTSIDVVAPRATTFVARAIAAPRSGAQSPTHIHNNTKHPSHHTWAPIPHTTHPNPLTHTQHHTTRSSVHAYDMVRIHGRLRRPASLGTPPLVHDRSIGSYRNPLVREGYPRRARDFATHGDDDAVLHPARDDDDDGDRRVED